MQYCIHILNYHYVILTNKNVESGFARMTVRTVGMRLILANTERNDDDSGIKSTIIQSQCFRVTCSLLRRNMYTSRRLANKSSAILFVHISTERDIRKLNPDVDLRLCPINCGVLVAHIGLVYWQCACTITQTVTLSYWLSNNTPFGTNSSLT